MVGGQIIIFKNITDKNFIQSMFLIYRLHRMLERGFEWISTTSDKGYYVNFQQKAEYACNNSYLMPFLELIAGKTQVEG